MVCSNRRCSRDGVKPVNTGRDTIYYCWVHHRIRQMRSKAHKKGKEVPAVERLEKLFKDHEDMFCRCCDKKMIMHSNMGSMSDVITLQHNADGTLILICFSCNSAHGQLPGDIYYHIPNGFKYCSKCDTIKPFSEFYSHSATRDGFQNYCKQCQAQIAAIRVRSESYRTRLASRRGEINRRKRELYHADIEKSRARGRRYYRKYRNKTEPEPHLELVT